MSKEDPAAPGAGGCDVLLSPLTVRGVTLQNRAVMGAMHTRLDALDRPAERIRAFYRARAKGEIGMIVTGGVAPNHDGRFDDRTPPSSPEEEAAWHRAILDSVAGTPTLVCMQILHTGRYGRFTGCVGPSARRSRINRYAPRPLATAEVWRTIGDFAATAAKARERGYHAVEIMGSEGYLLNQFTAPATNDRQDEFGGDFAGRVRFPLEVVKAVRARLGDDFPVMYRISALDLIEGGMPGEETAAFAQLLEQAGCDILNAGVGWHESLVPTIASATPRATWVYATRRIKQAVSIPVMASNRINDPLLADALLRSGDADLVSLARPLLADPDFVRKARQGRYWAINTCIACNQGCLDRIFAGGAATCLVNPKAGREIEFPRRSPTRLKRIAVVGGGAAGMSFAVNAAERGRRVTLFEASNRLGGQLLMASRVPGKSEFSESLRYFAQRLEHERVDVRLGRAPTAAELAGGGYDEIVIAAGARPRRPQIPGVDHPKVVDYETALLRPEIVGRRVAIVGAGGIGFDVAEFLLAPAEDASQSIGDFAAAYGLDLEARSPGGLIAPDAPPQARRELTLLQRKAGRFGESLPQSTGWIRRNALARLGVRMIGGVTYVRIDDGGLHVRVDGRPRIIETDSIVLCAGQEPERKLYEQLSAMSRSPPTHLIGGADSVAGLDALRAIEQATRLAMLL